jgi:hypothetical protein
MRLRKGLAALGLVGILIGCAGTPKKYDSLPLVDPIPKYTDPGCPVVDEKTTDTVDDQTNHSSRLTPKDVVLEETAVTHDSHAEHTVLTEKTGNSGEAYQFEPDMKFQMAVDYIQDQLLKNRSDYWSKFTQVKWDLHYMGRYDLAHNKTAEGTEIFFRKTMFYGGGVVFSKTYQYNIDAKQLKKYTFKDPVEEKVWDLQRNYWTKRDTRGNEVTILGMQLGKKGTKAAYNSFVNDLIEFVHADQLAKGHRA